LALSEGKPLPPLHCGEDARPLKMEDLKYAHEQVNLLVLESILAWMSGSATLPMCS